MSYAQFVEFAKQNDENAQYDLRESNATFNTHNEMWFKMTNAISRIEQHKQNEMNRRNVLLTNHYREQLIKFDLLKQSNVYVQSIDQYLFHVVIETIVNEYKNIDSIVVRFKSYSHDNFDELSKIYA